MQFVRRGPDVPERLLQAHEKGRVVFFCGAGISYPARLPGFAGLVDELYSRLEVIPDPVQAAAIKAKRYDTAVGLLEASFVGGCRAVRQRRSQRDPRSGHFCPECDCHARRAADSGEMPRASHEADHDQLRSAGHLGPRRVKPLRGSYATLRPFG